MRCWLLAAVLLTSSPAGRAEAQMADAFALAMPSGITAVHVLWQPRAGYAGRDETGVPRYIRRPFSTEERRLLRLHFGIEEPTRLYLSDSTGAGYLVYDTERDPGTARLVRSYRVGAPSIRYDGETWEALERRLGTLRPTDFPAGARTAETALDSLAPDARPHFERMLRDARAAGHRVRVVESYRSSERQAYLLVLGGGLTFTATSMHSSGLAVDVVVGDGDLGKPRTRGRWIAFRRWLAAYESGRFRMIGTPERSWDWPHVELAGGNPGFGSIEALLAAAAQAERVCCDPLWGAVHSSHDPARSGAVAFPRVGGGHVQVRLDGPSGRPALPAR